MNIHTASLRFSVVLAAVLIPFSAASSGVTQEVVVTAYYSPEPDQCCYVRGSFPADIVLNGRGVQAADGTPVYAGMAAAPPSYAYGTRVVLPGIGVVTVHDRGGAIQEWANAHRIDVWVGTGEEGLARALKFGVKRLTATVYPPDADGAPKTSVDLAALPSPPQILRPYAGDDTTLMDLSVKAGEQSASVQILQERLKNLGYLMPKPNGVYGQQTVAALQAFYRDYASAEPTDRLTEEGAALLEAAHGRRKAVEPVAQVVDASSAPSRIAEAQRTLRFIGGFHGRTTGAYDDAFRAAVMDFQLSKNIIESSASAGAGRIGPQTRKVIVKEWKRLLAETRKEKLLALRRIDRWIMSQGLDLAGFFGKGDRGQDVRDLQKFLVSKGLLQSSDVNGNFGPMTEQALITYQTSKGIVASGSAPGAGFAGPATLLQYRRDVRLGLWNMVRAQGWSVL